MTGAQKSRTRRAIRWCLEVIGIALLALVGGTIGMIIGLYAFFRYFL